MKLYPPSALLVAAVCAATTLGATSRVNIQVTNPTERQFRISYEQDAVTAKQRIFRIQLRDDNSATFELNLPRETELLMKYGGLAIPLYIGPDDQLDIRLDGAGGLETLTFSGPAAADNEFLADYARRFPASATQEIGGGFLPVVVEREVLAEAAAGDLESFMTYVNEGYSRRTDLIDGYAGRVDKDLVARYRTKNRYQAELKKLAYLTFNQQMLTPTDLRAAAARMQLRTPNGLKERDLLGSEEFKEYLKAYAQYLALPNGGAHDERVGDLLFGTIAERIDRPWRHYLQAELLVNAFDYLGNPEFGLDRYVAMKRDGASQVYRDRVETAYGEVLNLVPDAIAPNIGMYFVDGKPISLTDLSGKVVYISFWASWCKPCLANFKKYDGIRRQLQDKGVVLLNVSIDDDEYDWKRSLAKENPRGQNTRATNIEDVKRTYNLASIPAYYIIDKQGKIVVLPEGSNRNLLGAFDEIIAR